MSSAILNTVAVETTKKLYKMALHQRIINLINTLCFMYAHFTQNNTYFI